MVRLGTKKTITKTATFAQRMARTPGVTRPGPKLKDTAERE
jgi:hypothetical protein